MDTGGLLAVIAVFLVVALAGIPLAYATIIAAAFYFVFVNPFIPADIIPERTITSESESFTLLAVPLFLLAGDLLNRSGMTERLVAFAVAVVGGVRGGIGHSVVVANVIMAGMSGSATADAAGIGSMLIPVLTRAKWSPRDAAALTSAASTIGPIIPPSIVMVIYSGLADVSLGRLLLAGIIPGLLMGLFLMVNIFFSPRLYRTERTPFRLGAAVTTGRDAVLALVMPAIILGGMFGGVYTPTEGSAAAVLYALFIGVFVYRTLTPKVIYESLRRTATLTGAVLFIVGTAAAVSFILTREQAGGLLQGFISSISAAPLVTLIFVSILTLAMGTVMEQPAILALLTPVLVPVALHVGIDPIHFGLVFILASTIGLTMPPIGMCMFVTCRIADVTMREFAVAVWRPFVALLVTLLVVIVFPELALALPNAVMGIGK